MKVQIVDPAAYTPAYDHALCEALAKAGAEIELATGPFGYGSVPAPVGYRREERFYMGLPGDPGSQKLRLARAAKHLPDMLKWRKSTQQFDVVHMQWAPFQALDGFLLPRGRPLVMTAHDVLPREPRPGQVRAQSRVWRGADAIVVHSEHGRDRLAAEAGVDPARIVVIPHGPFEHLVNQPDRMPLPAELAGGSGPVVLMFGLIRPYKGLEVLLKAWESVSGARLWIVGRPRMEIEALRASAPESVSFLPRYVDDREIPAIFEAADLCALPYTEIDQSGVLATALAFGKPLLLSDAGGFPEVEAAGAAECVPAGDAAALAEGLNRLLTSPQRLNELAGRATDLATGGWSWQRIAEQHLELYAALADSQRVHSAGKRGS